MPVIAFTHGRGELCLRCRLRRAHGRVPAVATAGNPAHVSFKSVQNQLRSQMEPLPSHRAIVGHRAQGIIFPQLAGEYFKKIYGLGHLIEQRLHFF